MSQPPTPLAQEAAAIALAVHLSAQATELRQFAQALAAQEGTIQIERHLKSLEMRRAELQALFDEACGTVL